MCQNLYNTIGTELLYREGTRRTEWAKKITESKEKEIMYKSICRVAYEKSRNATSVNDNHGKKSGKMRSGTQPKEDLWRRLP